MKKLFFLTLGLLLVTIFSACKKNTPETPDPPQPDFLKKGLVAYYPLDGNDLDASRNKFNPIKSSFISATNRNGVADKAVQFNGTGNYIALPDTVTKNAVAFTFACWIKTTETKQEDAAPYRNPTILGYETGGDGSIDFGLTTNNGYVSLWGGLNVEGDNWCKSTYKINDNKWHFITLTYDLKMLKVYVDGNSINCQIKGTRKLTGRANLMSCNSSSSTPYFFHQGVIDEVRFYNRVLTDAEITSLYKLNN